MFFSPFRSDSSSSWRNLSYNFNYLYRALGFLRMGTTGLTAQAVWCNAGDDVLLVLLQNRLLTLALGLGILLLQYPLKVLSFFLLSTAPMVKASAQAYYDARMLRRRFFLILFSSAGF